MKQPVFHVGHCKRLQFDVERPACRSCSGKAVVLHVSFCMFNLKGNLHSLRCSTDSRDTTLWFFNIAIENCDL